MINRLSYLVENAGASVMALMVILLLCSLSPVCYGQGETSKSGTSSGTFLEIPVGAAAVGFGGAFVSRADNATALYWNPAGAANLTRNELVVSHTNWIAETKFEYGSFVLPLAGFGTIGLSYTQLSMDDMLVRTIDNPEGTGEYFSAGDLAVGVSYARPLTDRFSIGITGKYIQESIWHMNATAFAMDVGTLFRTDLFGGMVIGASLTNFGTSMSLNGRDARQFIRIDPSKQGSTDQIPTDIEMDSWNLPLSFQLGVSTNVVRNESYRLTVAADALHPSDNTESMNIGMEAAFQENIMLRAGYNSLFLTEGEGGLSLGLGVSSHGIWSSDAVVLVDYAYRDFGRLEGIHVLSIGLRF